MSQFIPKSFTYLRSGYTWQTFKKDFFASVGIAIIAIPLSMAFAIAAGTTPEKGLITAIVAGFCISLFGGSRTQIGGPTGAFVVIIYDIIQRNGYDGLATSTLIASCMLLLFAVLRVGSWIKLVPYPLIAGFTTGIACKIFINQTKGLLYLSSDLLYPSILLIVLVLLSILLMKRFLPKIPWAIGAICFGAIFSYILNLHVETIQSKFGLIPKSLPIPTFPNLLLDQSKAFEIFIDAIAIAFLAGIESLLSALAADKMMGSSHRSNCELAGQGIANFASVIFGGIPATGAIARTAANIKMGAQTPVSGMLHAIFLFLIIYFFSPLVSKIAMPILTAILMMVAWNMSEFPQFYSQIKVKGNDRWVLLFTFFLTIFINLTVAISLSMLFSYALFKLSASRKNQS